MTVSQITIFSNVQIVLCSSQIPPMKIYLEKNGPSLYFIDEKTPERKRNLPHGLGALSKECKFTYAIGFEKSWGNRIALDLAGWISLL